MDNHIEQLRQWLESQKGSTLSIEKQEITTGKEDLFDIDHVTFKLDHISLVSNGEDPIDDYLATDEVILHGEGTIMSDEGTVTIPQHAFEIPLKGEVTSSLDQNQLNLQTEQAIYKMKKQ
ncbi:hypothetical protein [Bacillus suaedae]|uniref:Uncharacterized protein n=1 Tax=Halalkalibacter suaedae TaxID=2822140 RepID=A0A940WT61_9BACI|nr:hypothetical protein [Bacillus suaedae]MBP3951308.1 hypothetical protein [Bacillus suaedae]